MYRSDWIQCGATIAGLAVRNVIVLGLGPVGLSAIMLEKIGIHTVGIDLIKSLRDFATSLDFEKIVDFTEK